MTIEAPVNPVPPLIIALAVVVAGIELIFNLGNAGLLGDQTAIAWRLNAVTDYAFSPRVLDWMVTRGDYGFDLIKRFVTYIFIHDSVTHALFGGALFLAMGKFVGDIFGHVALGLLILVSTVFGALVFGLTAPEGAILYGIYPPVYGLIGAYTYVLFVAYGRTGQNQLQAFRLIGLLLALQLGFGIFFGSAPVWIAEIAGFVVGFVASVMLAPGGFAAFLARMRNRRS